MGILVPKYIFADITCIAPSFLKEKGIKALALDVDNTLTKHGSQEISPEVTAWVELMRKNNILLTIASNNYKKRVAPFAEKIGIDYVSFACKPLPNSLAKVRKKLGVHRKEMALVGDQIFTDSLAAGFYGVTMFLVMPVAKDTQNTIVLKRRIEQPFINKYYKRGGKLL